jgi:signal transduction histidine kinase
VSSEITRLDRFVADLLVVAGRRKGPRARVPLGALARSRASVLAPWAAERGVSVEVSGDALAMIEEEAVARAVDNLVRNAVEASPTGKAVKVEVRESDEGPRITVIDEGAGVPEGREGELFEPFFTTKLDGTGLGLALSRAIASAQDGTIKYLRAKGRTCFEMSFPQPKEAHA